MSYSPNSCPLRYFYDSATLPFLVTLCSKPCRSDNGQRSRKQSKSSRPSAGPGSINVLQRQLTTLQAKNAILTNQVQGLQQATAAPQVQVIPPPVSGSQVQQRAPPSFALMPATTNLFGLINYSSKLGQMIYKQGCKKLTEDDGFPMTPATTVAFVKAFKNRCTIVGWNQGIQAPRSSQIRTT
jgi:hypothetical protein